MTIGLKIGHFEKEKSAGEGSEEEWALIETAIARHSRPDPQDHAHGG